MNNREMQVTAQVYDRREALARLGDDEGLFQTLVEMFIAESPGYLAEMEAAWQGADMPHLARVAHTLKGVLATFSARPAQQAAQALELAARSAQADGITDLIEATRRETLRFRAALNPA